LEAETGGMHGKKDNTAANARGMFSILSKRCGYFRYCNGRKILEDGPYTGDQAH
jgi:hypothetical protein